jgi:hypothetical protein
MDDILRIIRSRHSTRGAFDLKRPILKEVQKLKQASCCFIPRFHPSRVKIDRNGV